MTAASAQGEPGAGPTVRRIILGAQLRRLREATQLSRADAGYTIRASESKMRRLETGQVGFKERDVTDLLTLYGITNAVERQQFLDLVTQSNQLGWWHPYSDLIPKWFEDFVGLEEAASRIQTYELMFVPGLLQTEEYTRAVAGHGELRPSRDEIQRRVDLRRSRQKILLGPHAPKLWAIIDEAVLHRPIGGERVLRDQLGHLLEMTTQPNISVQVVPFHKSGSAAESAFTLLRFAEPELPNVAYIEHVAGALYAEKFDEIELYSRVMDRLAVSAETPDGSRQLLSKLRADI
ncbi:MAG TPA: helix-turn-helix transcriptional regulator [Pseudonocardiaceae bacterium]|nr:helix-turn-helix transcriptional regulator [Pseudonocardiaceae bacterium]